MVELEISEVSWLTKLKTHTLRYYVSIGLIKNIKRNSEDNRVYAEEDLKWLEFINRLRATGMNISKMKEYAGFPAAINGMSILKEVLVEI